MDVSKQLAQSQDVAAKVTTLFQKRLKIAQEHYAARVQQVQTYLSDTDAEELAARPVLDPRDGQYVKQALANIERGGYAEACARLACLVSRKGETLPLSRVTMRQDLAKEYAALLPEIELDQWRRMRGEQEIIVRYAPEEALATLPKLLDDNGRERLLTLLERVLGDRRIQEMSPSAEQLAMADRVRALLSGKAPLQLAVSGKQ